MKNEKYLNPVAEIDAELDLCYLLCTSPGVGENEGTEDEPLD